MVVIRTPASGDLERILKVEEESFPPGQRYRPGVIFYLLSLEGSVALVAEESGEVLGYAVGLIEWGHVGHVISIAVRPAFRRRGIGTALMRALEERLRGMGADRLRLEVRASNHEARRLYERLGYKVVRALPDYYGDEDGLLMEKPVR
ncbi:MAG: ribosomal protein S18-alanine N-acetyltransferase [Acidilobus sp.]